MARYRINSLCSLTTGRREKSMVVEFLIIATESVLKEVQEKNIDGP